MILKKNTSKKDLGSGKNISVMYVILNLMVIRIFRLMLEVEDIKNKLNILKKIKKKKSIY
jgi:hypothetical protein